MKTIKSICCGARGFTILELLVVIAIVISLAALLFPVFSAARENARRSQCSSNCHQIGVAYMEYVQDYDETTPAVNKCNYVPISQVLDQNPQIYSPWYYTIFPYIENWNVLMCPDRTDSFDPSTCKTAGVGNKTKPSGETIRTTVSTISILLEDVSDTAITTAG